MDSIANSLSVGFRLPPMEIFSLYPKPGTLTPDLRPPPLNNAPLSIIHPFTINSELYRISLQLKYAFTFVVAYVTAVFIMNQVNAARHYRPWAFSKTSTFKAAVFVHNVLLAVFSAWAICGALYVVLSHWPSKTEYRKESFYAHIAEFVCQRDSNLFHVLTTSTSLSEAGFFYYGWVFYMSKYYEVVDTMIILAKGKRCSTLQSYHHSGVILLGWSCIFYEPQTVLLGGLNAFIHTIMYTYFALQTLGWRIPLAFKRFLTSIQIFQFFVGLVFSSLVIFGGYRAPVRNDAALENTSPVGHGNHSVQGSDSPHRSALPADYLIPCMSDSGEGAPVLLTIVYLLPLTYLFVQFFIKSYMQVKVKGE